MIRDIPTRWLLLLAFLCAGLLPLMTVALVGYGSGRSELRRQALRQLESVRDIKRAQLTRFFKERRRDVDLLARDPYLLAAFTELEQSFRAAGGASGGRFAGQDRRKFKAPETYLAVHHRHFPYLSRFVDQRGYYDLLLLDGTRGESCFSVEKERDFAAVVAEQPTALRDVWREVVRSRRGVLSDTRPYPPSANAAAQFVAAPIERGGRLVGVVALQIGLSEVDAIVGELSGMGRTGDTRLVGSDFLPRADSARNPERTVQAAFLTPRGHVIVNEASQRALAGETGSRSIVEQSGHRVLAAWAPFDGAGTRWAMITQIDEAEINAQIDRALDRKVIALLASSVVAVVILALLLSLFLGRSIGSVGTQLVRLCDAVTRGDLSQRVAETDVSVDFRKVVHRINDLVEAFVERLDSIPVPILLVEPDLHIRFANSAACDLKGRNRAELIGARCCEAFGLGRSCDEHCLVAQAIERRSVVHGEVAGISGQAYLVTASPLLDSGGKVVGGFEVVVDRSEARRAERERRALEERVARMQRLEAVGTLAGGIAHDFNNILTYMFAYTDIVQGLLPEGSSAAPHVDQLVAAIQRAADLVAQILAFSRQAQLEPHPLDLGPLVKEAMKLVKASLSPSIALHVEVPDRPFTVMANPTQMHQVVLNLLTNARQAMAETGGRLDVRLDDEVLEPQDARVAASLPAGAYRVLEVKDTGCGMDQRTLERVFEPFFTTKPVGQGTGMGLALVHGIVTSAGGEVLAESSPGKGARFRVFLPRFEGEPVGTARDTPDVHGQGRRVLFVDDERRVCETSQQLLESLGYRVQALTSGADAIAEIEAHGNEYDVVVTDLRMPDVGGFQVAAAARSRLVRLPVVLTTAYADCVTPEQACAAGVSEVILKPFRKSDLARVLHGVLGQPIGLA